jgi:hypothetical protein
MGLDFQTRFAVTQTTDLIRIFLRRLLAVPGGRPITTNHQASNLR